jgi:hypothetical protein
VELKIINPTSSAKAFLWVVVSIGSFILLLAFKIPTFNVDINLVIFYIYLITVHLLIGHLEFLILTLTGKIHPHFLQNHSALYSQVSQIFFLSSQYSILPV